MAVLQIVPDLPDGTVSPEKRRDVTALFKVGKRMIREADATKRERLKRQYEEKLDWCRNEYGRSLWS